jgi:hypothetical protein
MSPFLTVHSIKRTQTTYSLENQCSSKQAQHLYLYIGREVVLTLLESLLAVYKYVPFNPKLEGRQNVRRL